MEQRKNEAQEIKEYFDAAEMVGEALGVEKISKEDYERFWKWMETPLMDVPDDELIWCYKQDKQNSLTSKAIWKSEIQKRKLKNVVL